MFLHRLAQARMGQELVVEAQKELIAAENFGDDESDAGKSSSNLVVLANCMRPISDVIQNAAADLKSSTLNILGTARHRQPGTDEWEQE